MTVRVSSNEARTHLGRLLRMTSEEDQEVIIQVRGEPVAVLLSYAAYEQFRRWQRAQKAQEALAKIRAVRARVQDRLPDLPPEEVYRRAGFGEQAIQEVLSKEEAMGEEG